MSALGLRQNINLGLSLKRLLRDSTGAIAVWGALAMPVVMGGAAFSVDASKMYNMDADLQSAADALARAAATELDRRDDSLTRATRAVQTLVRNDQKFSDNGRQTVKVESIRFLKAVPASAEMAVPASMVTNDPEQARYIEVNLSPENVRTIFPTKMVARTLDVQMDATSIAGRSQRICGVAPVFVCNPYEDTNRTIYEAMDAGDLQKRQVQFKRPTGSARACSSQYGPGSFGYLEIPGYTGANAMRKAVGIDTPDICFEDGGTVRLKSGNINSMHMGFNVRFDIYEGPMKRYRSDPRYAPAANVVKGYAGPVCKSSPSGSALGLPRDNCQNAGPNACYGWGRNIGDGQWDFMSYMSRNHNNMRKITIAGTTYTMDYRRRKMTPSTPPTRYEMYRWEIDNDCVPGKATYGKHASTAEEGLPQCHTSGASTADVDRRIIYAAVLNCRELDHTIGMLPNQDLPVETFVKVFLTEPVGSGSEPTIFGEIIGPVVEGEDSVSSERAELTR